MKEEGKMTTKALTKQIQSSSTEALTCRSFGHAWNIDGIEVVNQNGKKAYIESVSCVRCATRRRDTVLTSGVVSYRNYMYPDGYRLSGVRPLGASYVKRNVRIFLIRRVMEGAR